MYIKIIGALLIIGCCGGYGMLLALSHRRLVLQLRQLEQVYGQMYAELEYRLTPIPELCRLCAAQLPMPLCNVFMSLAEILETQSANDVSTAMCLVLERHRNLPTEISKQLELLGHNLGRFDLPGQLRGLCQCKSECERKRNELEHNQQQRLRSYQTLGFCAGAALAILLF